MKKIYIFYISLVLGIFFTSCSTHVHLDLLGEEQIQEVVLVKSDAKDKILVIDITGVIGLESRASFFNREADLVSSVYYRLRKATEDPNVKAIILRLDTPGGEITASDIIYHEIMRFKAETNIPVVALMMSVAASGGYYIASAADYIIAHPTTITGSIGVISVYPNVEGLFGKIGVDVTVIKSGKMKDSGSPLRTMTQEEKDYFQGLTNEYYEQFLSIVHKRVKNDISLETLRTLADGRIYTAKQAVEKKLINTTGYFSDAFDKSLVLAHILDAQVVAYTYYPKSKTNIYAANIQDTTSLINVKSFEEHLPKLKTGFYYLWLPESME